MRIPFHDPCFPGYISEQEYARDSFWYLCEYHSQNLGGRWIEQRDKNNKDIIINIYGVKEEQ